MDATKILEFGVKYTGFWEGDAAVKGIFSTTEAATADGVVSLDELLSWNLNWTGNGDVAGFSLDSTSDTASALVSPDGFIIGGANTPVNAGQDADGVDQGLYESATGEKIIDLGALLVEDFAAGKTAAGDASAAGTVSVSPIVDFAIDYSGYWANDGGGSIKGIFSASEADAADGVVYLDEIVSWKWDWSGNDAVAAFSLSSEDGSASSLIPPDGFKIGGINTPVALDFSDADGLDQGLYESTSGDQIIDLGVLLVENGGARSIGDVTANGTIAASKVLNFTTEFSGYWDNDGGGAIKGGFSASAADAADGIVSIDEIIDWNWSWTGNDKVEAFSMASDGGTATALLPNSGFRVDGNKVAEVDFNDSNKLDQGLYESADGSKIIDIGALLIEDFTTGSFTEGVVKPPVVEPPVDETPKTLFGNNSNGTLEGAAGDDKLFGNGGATTLIGNAGNDKIYGSDLAEKILGGEGDDVIYANGGLDYIDAGTGLDQVWLGGASEATVVLNQGDGYTTIANYQAGSTRLKVASLDGLSLANSDAGLRISQGGDLLAVVAYQTKGTFNIDSFFAA